MQLRNCQKIVQPFNILRCRSRTQITHLMGPLLFVWIFDDEENIFFPLKYFLENENQKPVIQVPSFTYQRKYFGKKISNRKTRKQQKLRNLSKPSINVHAQKSSFPLCGWSSSHHQLLILL